MFTRKTVLILIGGLSVLSVGSRCPAQEPSVDALHLVSATAVSGRFQREAEVATKSIPDQVWRELRDAGWRVQLAEFVVDAAPTLRGVRPRGWPRYLTWDNSDAIHLPQAKLLIVAERRRNRAGEIVNSSRVAGVLRHEIGHAFDMAAGENGRRISETAVFANAYRSDTNRIESQHRESLAYYLQDSHTGRQETFAEAFAAILGGGSSDVELADFENHFPQTVALTRRVLLQARETQQTTAQQTTAQSHHVFTTQVRRRIIRRR